MSKITVIFDRRELIVAAGAAAAVAYLPAAAFAAQVGAAQPKLADWHIDDMWGVYPRPSEAIGNGRPRGDGELVAGVAAADLAFLSA
jgi:hypothetical protein